MDRQGQSKKGKEMKDYITIGCSPVDEDCAQVGQADYHERALAECKALIGQIRRVFGEEPEQAQLKIKAFPHDFGTYHEVVCYFNDDEDESMRYAFAVEGRLPDNWDKEAREELQAKGFAIDCKAQEVV